ncbi:hypothetical protein [Jannaschia sp. 2305UL9-9]|uniref:hypothetical protein n=1 Tax=Jannaschia sp. 2305UL9-9 TaxID=3121638 RepID=UPI0035298DFD
MTRAPDLFAPDLARFRRSPKTVMRLSRLGAAHPTRLSFLRILLRRMRTEGWQVDRRLFDIDERGVGRAVYCVRGPVRTYSLVAFGHDLPADERSDRVIATAWDATFALFDGVPDADDLARLQANVPLQEAGRISQRELTLSRANRSVRLFDHVVATLAEGRQPDANVLAETGYLMRTTAVYGSGKFGAACHGDIVDRPEMSAPFQAEMLTVWLIRAFTVDLVDHLARLRGGPNAARLDDDLRRGLGVGNSTGLGMAPFLVRHPALLHNWIFAREEALARVRAQPVMAPGTRAAFARAISAARECARQWRSAHPLQMPRLAGLRSDLDRIERHSRDMLQAPDPQPWDRLWRWGEASLTLEGQEALLAAMLEPHGPLIDDLGDALCADEAACFDIDGAMSVGTLRAIMANTYDWADAGAYGATEGCARFWYVSEDKLEPRLGERHTEPGAERELPLDIGRRAAALSAELETADPEEAIAHLLLRMPQHRYMVRRVQIAATRPYAEIRDNLISADVMPIDMLRCKLACFGARQFDPRSDRWVRINLFQDAPFPGDLNGPDIAR